MTFKAIVKDKNITICGILRKWGYLTLQLIGPILSIIKMQIYVHGV